ncbi:MAG: hypothetical protein V3S98_07315 [Dehalococcoidia bacterium]
MALALSHGGKTVNTAATPSDKVLVGTLDGVATLERDGDGWRIAERTLTGNHVHALLLEEESGTWFAGVRKGGIYASHDGGSTWERSDDGVTEEDIYSLASAKVDGHVRLFAGTEPAHLFVSDDLGKSWTDRPGLRDVPSAENWSFPAPPHIGHLKHINFSPSDPRTMWGSIEQGGLLKSTDGGVTWADKPGMNDDVHRTVIDPNNPDRMYITGGGGLWITDDAGDSWSNPFGRESDLGGYTDQLVFKPSDPTYMVMSAGAKSPNAWREEHTARTRITRSRDAGSTWEVITKGISDDMTHAVEAMTLEEAGSTVQIFAANTGGDVLWSNDAGETWSVAVSGLAPISKGGHYQAMAGAAAS